MRKAAYSLIALDLDGTILPRERPISTRVERAIRAVVEAGAHVTLASGRMFRTLQPYAEQLGLRDALICYGGALLRHAETGAVLFERHVPLVYAREVVQAGRELGHPVHAYVGDELYVEGLTPSHPMHARLRSAHTHATDDLDAFLLQNGIEPHHMALVTPDDPKALVLRLRRRLAGRLSVTSGHPNLAELDHASVSKGAALAWLAERLDIPQSQVMAVGDDWNDLSMITYAGLGVAMGHAPAEVLAAAKVIAPGVEDDGLAEALEKYVLMRDE